MSPEPNLVLTGFMGTGKTTVGRRVAHRLAKPFVDTDEIIEASHGPISVIFEEHGEAGFRGMERAIAARLAKRTGLVIATGGRLLLDLDNLKLLSGNARFFCLVASPEVIHRRVGMDPNYRPLLGEVDLARRIAELLAEREPGYRVFPRLTTDRGTPDQVVDELVALWSGIRTVDPHEDTRRHIVGAGLLPIVRQLAGIDGPIVLITGDDDGMYEPLFGEVELAMMLPRRPHPSTTITSLTERMLDAGIGPGATVVALGNDSIADISSSVAATCHGGLDVVHCPSDLGSMITPMAKFQGGREFPKHPKTVIADVSMLQEEDVTVGMLGTLVGEVAEGLLRARLAGPF
ncbi:MAG: shikimate kinase [Actinomycetota bacterium]